MAAKTVFVTLRNNTNFANWRKNGAADLNLFSLKVAQLLFRQLQKLSARNIAALKCESRKNERLGPSGPPSCT